jgi:glycerophosphoryl diester phosphodiesterase
MTDLFIWAHRGASRTAPENTLAAFRAAEKAGADGIELDVHLSREGVPVVMHDERVDRTTDGRGEIRRLSLRALRQLDAGSWFSPAFAGEPVPALEEVLRWGGDRMRLNIEIKSAPAGEAVLDHLHSFPRADVLVSSFDHDLLEYLHQSAPRLPLAFLCDSPFWRRPLRRAAACEAESFHPRWDRVSRAMMAACRRHGIGVVPWTVDDVGRLRALQRLGVSGIFTNDPEFLVRYRKSTEEGSSSRMD